MGLFQGHGTKIIHLHLFPVDKSSQYMLRCVQLARQGAGYVAPNPMVGAVLVYQDRIIGEGYHKEYGGPHAEVNCIGSVAPIDRPLIKESVLYVSLEPCAHHGKTPPCADLIISHGIPEVVVGCRDPFTLVDGKGIEKLRQAGVRVHMSSMEEECKELNKRFLTFHLAHRPYIILKWAQSGNGKIADFSGRRLMISNEITQKLTHRWRSEEASILVGTNTAMMDNPLLDTRHWGGAQPTRIVIDLSLRLPEDLKIFNITESRTIVFNTRKHCLEGKIWFFRLDLQKGIISQIVQGIYDLGIQSVLIEGGARLLQSFIDEGAWDEARIISNKSLVFGDGLDAPRFQDALLVSEKNILNDQVCIYEK
jgi:diaminohydroxyphosphoribosylaminopyrimidine deaminase/5-amino-6-(5-phosphoribosylamino)uracil reductase